MQKVNPMTRNADLTDYALMRDRCNKTSLITEYVFDDLIIDFAAEHHDLAKKMDQNFARFRHILTKYEKSDVEFFKSQYIVHKVFREGGLIGKFLKNPAFNRFSGEERDYLIKQAETPWRFSFSEIVDEPVRDFYVMKDPFTEEEYLLYSPSITDLKADGNKLLWFNLIGFNGSCWQSYGPIGAYQSFGPEDIYFFATEKNMLTENISDVQKDIENDPLPYMMLSSGSAFPRTFNKDNEIIFVMAEHKMEKLNTAKLKEQFISEYNNGVYRFTHKAFGAPPHFAQLYFDENEKILLFQSLTETGFRNLIKDFNAFGYMIPDIPYLKVRPHMVATTQSILKTRVVLNEYEELFQKTPDPLVASEIDKLNKFISLILPMINEGRKPDIEEAARKTGISLETANDLIKIINEKKEGIKKKYPVKENELPSGKETYKSRKADINTDPFNTIYMAANLIFELEPWKNLYETEIFGVKMPGSGRIYFISVMGINGEFKGIAAYKDYTGLSGFFSLQNYSGSLPETILFTIPHLMLSFTNREDLDKNELKAIKKSGVTFRGKGQWPKITEVIPGFVPIFPEGESLNDLPVLLEQILSVLIPASKNPNLLSSKGPEVNEILIRIPKGNSADPDWRNHYINPEPDKAKEKYKINYNRESIESVSKLKTSNLTLQSDLFLIPNPVMEKGKKGYFPFMMLLVDKNSGMVPGMNVLQPIQGMSAMYESFPQKLLEEILKLGYRPAKIEFRSDLLFELAKNALTKSGLTPVLVKKMPLMDETIKSLFDHLNKR